MSDEFDLFAILTRHRVPFVIIGGHAVNYHGYVRGTDDADVVWQRTPASEAALLEALTESEAKYIGTEKDADTGIEKAHSVDRIFIRTTHLMMLWTPRGFIDLFDHPPGEPAVDVQELFDSAVESEGLRFVSLAWLRRLKRTAGRTKDLLDLQELEKVHGPPPVD